MCASAAIDAQLLKKLGLLVHTPVESPRIGAFGVVMVLYHTKPVWQHPAGASQSPQLNHNSPPQEGYPLSTPIRTAAELRLCNCDVRQCEAMCCYDGAYLEPQEEQFLHELLAK